MFTLTSFRDKSLSSVSQAGLVNNLNDGLAWGLFPILFATAGLSIQSIGIPAAVAVVGALTAASGLVVAARTRGTDHLDQGYRSSRASRAQTFYLPDSCAGCVSGVQVEDCAVTARDTPSVAGALGHVSTSLLHGF